MRVGVISDVHANAPALESVLDDMPPVDEVYHAGDVVGYGPYPRETLALFREHGIESIQGNHDRGLDDATSEEFRERYHPLAAAALAWTRARLADDERRAVLDLPAERSAADGRVRVVHGAPNRPDEYVYPDDVSPDLLGEEEVLVLGHTHQQVARGFADGLVLNPGSVGQPRDGDPTAAYAVVDLDDRSIRLRRVAYPYDRVREAIRESDLPDELADRIGP